MTTNRKLAVTLLLNLLLFLTVNSSTADECKWVECSGEAAMHHITHEEAQLIAKRKARLDAIEKVCGIRIQAETMVKNFVMAGDFIHSISHGQVVEEKDIKWQTENLPPENPTSPPIVLLKLTMKARVAITNDKPDPAFKIQCKINRSVFQTGDAVIFNIKATKDCYITIFNLAANDSVYILFPNEHFVTSNFIKAGQTIEIPNQIDRSAKKSIRVATLPGHKEDTETVKIVATKEEIKFADDFDNFSGFEILGTPKVAVYQIAKWLSEIPVSERAESSIIYTINSRVNK